MCTEKKKTDKDSSKSSSSKHDDSNKHLLYVSGVVIFIWLLYLTCAPRIIPGFKCLAYWLLPHGLLYRGNEAINWGTFGDYFGALNCLFAGLAFAAVYVSIKQQNTAINIQQDELEAQLAEMIDSVHEAKEQNGLQREYQFTDEFYRRINLLKLTEKDIWFNKSSGQIAILEITSNLSSIIGHIRKGEIKQAKEIIAQQNGGGLHEMVIGFDMFSVWTETFTNTVIWLQEHFCQELEIKTREASSLCDTALKEQIIANACEDLAKKQKHYEAVLISSTFWATLSLLYIQLHKKSKLHIIESLLRRYSYKNGEPPLGIPENPYLNICSQVLSISTKDDITKQLQKIHDTFFPNKS